MLPNAQVFHDVWYLPQENTWSNFQVAAFRDIGRLMIHPDSFEFLGKKTQLIVHSIHQVSLSKQGRDFINTWVRVEYGQAPDFTIIWLADGTLLGWGGLFGGTRRIAAALQRLIK